MKISTLKYSLLKAGFDYLPKRGKGSHSMWKYPFSNKKITISGQDNNEAKPYQIKAYERAIAQVSTNS